MLNLSFQLLKLFAEGGLPATTVQKLAAAAWSDGWGVDDDVAKRLAGLGADGTYPGNCLRDLLRMSKVIGIGGSTPEPYMKSVETSGGGYRHGGVFLPHEEIAKSVQTHGKDAPCACHARAMRWHEFTAAFTVTLSCH